jgi:ERF superfamily
MTTSTITKIAPALLAAQKAMGNATKGSANPYFKSTYADLNAIREVAIPALNSVGIVILQPTVTREGKNYVETLLLHESGECLSSLTEIRNTKGDAQSEGSGISYARRYGLQSFLNIGAVDDDGESTMDRKTEGKTETKTPASFKKAAVGVPTSAVATSGTTPKATTAQAAAANGGDDW